MSTAIECLDIPFTHAQYISDPYAYRLARLDVSPHDVFGASRIYHSLVRRLASQDVGFRPDQVYVRSLVNVGPIDCTYCIYFIVLNSLHIGCIYSVPRTLKNPAFLKKLLWSTTCRTWHLDCPSQMLQTGVLYTSNHLCVTISITGVFNVYLAVAYSVTSC